MTTHTQLQRTLSTGAYVEPQVFIDERERIFRTQWFLVAHSSEFVLPGDFKRINVLDTDILLVKQHSGEIKAFANRCIHRGATLVQETTGNKQHFVCPYHAWCYSHTGMLASTRNQATPLENHLSLQDYTIEIAAGLVLFSFAPPAQAVTPVATLLPYWQFYGSEHAMVLHREQRVCKANWKIVVENFLECFHCAVGHPELAAVEKHVDLLERQNIHRFIALQQAYFKRAEALGHPIPPSQFINSQVSHYCVINAVPLSERVASGTQNGQLVARLMGKQTASDGGFLYGSLGPFIHFTLYSDYCVLFNFSPVSVSETEVSVTWLVDEQHVSTPLSEEQKEAICWLWQATIEQDCRLCELVWEQANSYLAKPGYYTTMEAESANFCSWYTTQYAATIKNETVV